MIKITHVAEKPSAQTPWNKKLNSAVMEHIRINYQDTYKFLSAIHTFSNNDMVQTSVSLFESIEDYQEYRNDPQLASWFESLREHRAVHGITLTTDTLIEEIAINDPYVIENFNVFKIVSLDHIPKSIEDFLED